MDNKESPHDIFRAAAQHKAPVKPKTPESKPAAPAEAPVSNKDVLAMIEKMRKMHDQLEKELDEAYQKTGLSPKEVTTFLDNPSNFAGDEFTAVQQQRKSLLSRIMQVVDPKGIESTKKKAKKEAEAGKQQKGKTLGARKNWIPMR